MKHTPLKLAGLIALSSAIAACGGGGNSTTSNSSSTSSEAMSSSSMMSSSSAVAAGGFEAVISDFAGYDSWDVVDYSTGASNNGLGGAHAAGNNNITRKTFKNMIAMNSSDGEYEQGSILIKETFTYTMGVDGLEKTITGPAGLLAMVKRGEDFNPEHNGWEWFMLEPDLSGVIAQGETPNDNPACNACHSKAETQTGGWDYTFPKPTEYAAETSIFADYTTWDLIEFDESPENLAGGAHIDNANLRRVFQKHVYANPTDAGDMGYPVGTTIVKDISTDDGIEQIVAMVKRGGNFDPDNGNWEYFMLNPEDPTEIAMMEGSEVRGAVPMCIGCHVKAKDDAGTDFVFKHQHAPFNTDSTGEYITTKASLMDYTNWEVTDYATGNSNPFLGGAHASSNTEVARQVFENATALGQMDDSAYMQGSIIAKEVFTIDDMGDKVFTGVFAMAKRGGDFNPDHGNWEWLILDGEQNIVERGSDLKAGACNACHSKGMDENGVDYTFGKPSEFIVTVSDFADYKTWTLLGEDTGNSAANGSAHNTSAVRKTYRKQMTASPYVEKGEYPIGTLVLKELTVNGEITTIYGMAKRGGGVNPDQNGWEFFTMDEGFTTLNKQSAVGCGGCHGAAGNAEKIAEDDSFLGADFIFYKENDPVPMPMSAM